MNLNREHYRAMIFYDYQSGLSASDSLNRLSTAFPDSAPSRTTVYEWYSEFRNGRVSLKDSARVGRPMEATNEENVEAIRGILSVDSRVTIEYLSDQLGISTGSVHNILHDKLKMRRISARWVPHLLSQDQKNRRVTWCEEMLFRYQHGESRQLRNLITGDETWVYCYDPESKQQSSQWTVKGQPPPTKVVKSRSVVKKMVATFFMMHGHVSTVPVENQRTVTSFWYITECLPRVIDDSRQFLSRRSPLLLHHDNAPAHSAHQTGNFLAENNVALVGHPPYSPDLAPCDFFLFPRVKAKLRGRRFPSVDDAVTSYLDEINRITPDEWTECYQNWFKRMRKCVNMHGEYFEKM